MEIYFGLKFLTFLIMILPKLSFNVDSQSFSKKLVLLVNPFVEVSCSNFFLTDPKRIYRVNDNYLYRLKLEILIVHEIDFI